MWRAAARLLALALAAALLAGCASVGPVVKIGLVAPFEGRDRAVGYDAIYAARLAVREVNARGGIDGTRVALVALDDRGDPTLATQTAAALVVDPGVVEVVYPGRNGAFTFQNLAEGEYFLKAYFQGKEVGKPLSVVAKKGALELKDPLVVAEEGPAPK